MKKIKSSTEEVIKFLQETGINVSDNGNSDDITQIQLADGRIIPFPCDFNIFRNVGIDEIDKQ